MAQMLKQTHFSILISCCLVLLLSWVLARLTWLLVLMFLPDAPVVSTGNLEVNTVTSDSQTTNSVVQNIQAVNLFGVAGAKPVVKKEPVKAKKVLSPLNLKLLGVIAGGDLSRIALVEAKGVQRAYLTGEEIPVGRETVKLKRIEPDHIVIERKGREEIVKLNVRTLDDVKGLTVVDTEPPAVDKVDLKAEEFTRLVGNARQTLRNDPLKLSRYFAVKPVRKEGKLQGYELREGRDKRLFAKLPLENSDLLTGINGQDVASLSLTGLYQLLEENTQFEITVLRQGTPISFTVSF